MPEIGLIVSLETITISVEGWGGGLLDDDSPKYGHVHGGGRAISPSCLSLDFRLCGVSSFEELFLETEEPRPNTGCSWKLNDRFLGVFGDPDSVRSR